MRYLIVGAGFSGAVVAEQLSRDTDNEIIVMDERSHVGGNCYTERDAETDVMIHRYGPHIFHTDDKEVWEYICRFCDMKPFINRVKTVSKGKVYSIPVNLHTINQFAGKAMNPQEARNYIEHKADKSIENPRNFEEQALKFIGRELYEAFFYGYTKKQWGCEPDMLPASILKRLPVRFNYDDNYYDDQFQGIPVEGYTEIVNRMLDRTNIKVQLNAKFSPKMDLSGYNHVFYTGPIDEFFTYKYGRLSYRTVSFEKNVCEGDFQGNAVINYADEEVPYTRIHEHKHFTQWENHRKTVYFKEFSKETMPGDMPYYPKRLSEDLVKLEHYQKETQSLQNITFLGRLGTYRYMDMKDVIREAIDCATNFSKIL